MSICKTAYISITHWRIKLRQKLAVLHKLFGSELSKVCTNQKEDITQIHSVHRPQFR